MPANFKKLMSSIKSSLISTTIYLIGITHVGVHYTGTLHVVLLHSTMPIGRVTSVTKISMTSNFKAYTRDLGVKLYEAPLSIRNDSSSLPIIPYKYSNPT